MYTAGKSTYASQAFQPERPQAEFEVTIFYRSELHCPPLLLGVPAHDCEALARRVVGPVGLAWDESAGRVSLAGHCEG